MSPERILAVKLADLGDLLLTEPALRSLSTAYPDARIDVLTTPASSALLEMLPGSYGCLTFAKHDFDSSAGFVKARAPVDLAAFGLTLRRSGYDAVAIFHHLTTPAGSMKFRALARSTGAAIIAGLDNGRAAFLTHRETDLGFGVRHEAEYMLGVSRSIGGADVDPAPRLKETLPTASPLAGQITEPYAAVFPVTGPFAPGRNWPVESFADLARSLAAGGLTPVILGATDASGPAALIRDVEPRSLDLTGRTDLTDLGSIVAGARVTVTGDSFPGHLARAVGSPVVSIFGPSNQMAWKPYGAVEDGRTGPNDAVVVRHDVPCSPCLYTGYRLGRRAGCPNRICLTRVTVEDVMVAVERVIGSES